MHICTKLEFGPKPKPLERKSETEMKVKRFYFIVFLIFSVFSDDLINRSNSDESTLEYSVTISMRETMIYGAQKINVSFAIAGIGNISSGSVCVYSDVINILANTFKLQQYILDGGVVEGPKYEPVEQGKKGTILWIPISPTRVPKDSIHFINGDFQIDTDGMPIGSYRLRVVFFAEINNDRYAFEDSIEYRVIDIWEKYPFLQYLITFLSSLAVYTIITEYRMRRERTKEEALEEKVAKQERNAQ